MWKRHRPCLVQVSMYAFESKRNWKWFKQTLCSTHSDCTAFLLLCFWFQFSLISLFCSKRNDFGSAINLSLCKNENKIKVCHTDYNNKCRYSQLYWMKQVFQFNSFCSTWQMATSTGFVHGIAISNLKVFIFLFMNMILS